MPTCFTAQNGAVVRHNMNITVRGAKHKAYGAAGTTTSGPSTLGSTAVSKAASGSRST
jgi:hypothetical protein